MKRWQWLAVAMLLYPALLFAQWELYTPWQMEGAQITDLDTIRCGGEKMVIATTTKGVFLNPTAEALPATWIDISANLSGRSFQNVAVRDSLIFVAETDGEVYAAVITSATIPACVPTRWVEWSNGLRSYHIQDLLVRDSLLIAATNNGLWYQILHISTTATLEQSVTSNIWTAADTSNTPFLLSLAALPQGVFVGSKLSGAFYYDPRCFGTTQSQCVLYDVTPEVLQPLTIYAVASVEATDVVYQYPPNYVLQARGFYVGTGEGRNLYFCPVLYDSLFILPQLWVDISPSLYHPAWFWQVLSILPVRLDSTQLALVVGTRFGGILVSTDGGNTWSQANTTADSAQSLEGTNVRKLFQLNDSTVVAVLDGGALVRSPAIGFIKTTALLNVPTAVRESAASGEPVVWWQQGSLCLRLPGKQPALWTVQLYSVSGAFLGEWEVTAPRACVSLVPFPAGVYFCILRNGEQVWAKVVERW